MKCGQCGYETMSMTYFMEHMYGHQSEVMEMEEVLRKEKKAVAQFKVLLNQYDKANIDYINTPDEAEAARLKTLRTVLSDHIYHMYCDYSHLVEINRLWDMFF